MNKKKINTVNITTERVPINILPQGVSRVRTQKDIFIDITGKINS